MHRVRQMNVQKSIALFASQSFFMSGCLYTAAKEMLIGFNIDGTNQSFGPMNMSARGVWYASTISVGLTGNVGSWGRGLVAVPLGYC